MIVEYVLYTIGAASVVAAILRSVLPWLQAKALETSITADDKAVEALALFYEGLCVVVDLAKKLSDAIALNPMPKLPTKGKK